MCKASASPNPKRLCNDLRIAATRAIECRRSCEGSIPPAGGKSAFKDAELIGALQDGVLTLVALKEANRDMWEGVSAYR
eukprot:1160558-Pleurochrysis_carterae.AAC.1